MKKKITFPDKSIDPTFDEIVDSMDDNRCYFIISDKHPILKNLKMSGKAWKALRDAMNDEIKKYEKL